MPFVNAGPFQRMDLYYHKDSQSHLWVIVSKILSDMLAKVLNFPKSLMKLSGQRYFDFETGS